MWSLGCVYLEFLVWLIEGVKGLTRFHDARFQHGGFDPIEDDIYFTLIPTPDGRPGGAVVRVQVTEYIAGLRKSPRCSKAFKAVLDLVEHKLLVVEQEKRIPAFDLYAELTKIIKASNEDLTYLVIELPSDKGKGFKVPYLPAGLKWEGTEGNQDYFGNQNKGVIVLELFG